MDFLTIAGLVFLMLLSFYILHREGVLDTDYRAIFAMSIIAIAFLFRAIGFSHITLDYSVFLADWTQYFRDNGGFFGLADVVGNYNLPYLYFLAFFSYLPVSDLFLIKLLSTLFDVILALGVSRIVLFYTDSKLRQLFAFLAVLLLPTAILNGAVWAQCDSIFTAFAVWAFYFALIKSPKKSLAFAAISLSFKIQAIFFLPIYAIFLLSRHIKLRDIWVFPTAYVITLVPAVAFGHSAIDAISVYFRQVDGADGSLNYNSSSIFALIPYKYEAPWLDFASYIGIFLAAFLILVSIIIVFVRKNTQNDRTILGFATLLTLGIPFFLPHMHDRYFFLADIFTLILAIISPSYCMSFFFCLFGSLLGYHAYLKNVFFLTMDHGAIALLFGLIIICIYISNTFDKMDDNYEENSITNTDDTEPERL